VISRMIVQLEQKEREDCYEGPPSQITGNPGGPFLYQGLQKKDHRHELQAISPVTKEKTHIGHRLDVRRDTAIRKKQLRGKTSS